MRKKRIISFVLLFALCVTSVFTGTSQAQAAKKAVKSVVVKNPVISTLTMQKGTTFNLRVQKSPNKAKLTYTSSKKSVVSVNKKGKLSARKTGKATIKVTASYGNKKTVKIKLSQKNVSLYIGNTCTLTATISPKKATNKKMLFKSSSKSIATVNSKGKVTAKGEGTAKITVYAQDGRGAKAVCTVNVKKKSTPSKAPQVTVAPKKTNIEVANRTQNIAADIYLDSTAEDYKGLSYVAASFANDVELVSGVKPAIKTDASELGNTAVIAGTIGENSIIDALIANKKINVSSIKGKWEVYQISLVENPTANVDKAIVICGSDKRGTIYGIYHISELMGVSPWVYWGDVTPESKDQIVFTNQELDTTSAEPSVKYRGIFLNDEAPSLTGWVKDKFGNYNEKFYEKVYELILRLKGNYLWPAMWSNNFSEDGTDSKGIANAKLADEYGIVMGTSHHEPLCRAGNEWQQQYSKYGSSNAWDFTTNSTAISKFWEDGIKRNGSYENIITVGMRGESDSSLEGTVEENIQNLKNVITTQNQLLKNNNLQDVPTMLTIYKEVEQYWYGTDEVEGLDSWDGLNNTTIMLTDDNFGNVRTLPTKANKNRSAGWGMYYHFDYHGGPRSYEWVDTIQLEKVWEQMSKAYDYGVDDVWIVNVGDLKPMELPISYFLDLAYDYDTYGSSNAKSASEYMTQWTNEQFGSYATKAQLTQINEVLTEYTKINASRKPEIVTSDTYSVENYNEAMRMLNRVNGLITKAESLKTELPEAAQSSYYELVYYPAVASANVQRMQLYSALNKLYYTQGRSSCNQYAKLLEASIKMDKTLQNTYNNAIPGVGDKWKNMMSSPHVGYSAWDSTGWAYPTPKYLKVNSDSNLLVGVQGSAKAYKAGEQASLPDFTSTGKETYYIDLANEGGNSYNYSVQTSAPYISVSKTSGTVSTQDTIGVSIDYSKVTADSTGSITIKSEESTVQVNVNVKFIDVSGLANKTFIEHDNYISMEAKSFTKNSAASDGAKWTEIANYGKTESAFKVYPDAKSYTDMSKAPYMEYAVKVNSSADYVLQTYLGTVNNTDWSDVTLKTGVSVDGGAVTQVDAFTSSYTAGTGSPWQENVMENINISETTLNLTKGVHKIRLYAVDAGAVVQKLVLYNKAEGLKKSFFGPEESYYVGKKVETSSLITDIQKQVYVLPCTIATDTRTSYPAIVSTTGLYNVAITAQSTEEAKVKVSYGTTVLGIITVNGSSTFAIDGDITLSQSEGNISYEVTSGTATVSGITVSRVDLTPKEEVYVSASSEQAGYTATNAFDNTKATTWKPETSDTTPSLTFDYNEDTYFDYIVLRENGSNVTSYEIQTYSNNKWETVSTQTTISSGSRVYFHGKTPVHGNKLRVKFKSFTEAPEIIDAQVNGYINWSVKDGDVTLSGALNSGTALTVPDTVVDGDRQTKAMEVAATYNLTSGAHNVVMEFSEARSINQLNIISQQRDTDQIPDNALTSAAVPQKFIVYYDRNGSWVQAGSVEEATDTKRKVLNEINFSKTVQTKKIKIEIFTSYWIRLVELEAVRVKNTAAATNETISNVASQTANEVILSKKDKVGRIDLTTTNKEGSFTFSYWDETTATYKAVAAADLDIQPTEDGISASLANPVSTTKVKVEATDSSIINKLTVWSSLYREEEGCTCTMQKPELTNNSNVVIGYNVNSTDVILSPLAHQSTCALSSHNTGNVEIAYDIVSDPSNIASIKGNTMHVTAPGTVLIKLITKKNNRSRFIIKKFVVTKDTQVSEDYKDWALTENGAQIQSVTGSCIVSFNNVKQINSVSVTSSAITDEISTSTVYFWKDSQWTLFEDTAITPAVKVVYTGTIASKDNITVHAMGEPYATTGCQCQVGELAITNEADVKLPESNSVVVNLAADYFTYCLGCTETGHKDSSPEVVYSIESDVDNIAAISGSALTITKEGKVTVQLTVSLNGVSKNVTKEFTVVKEGRENFALASNGATVSVSAGSEGTGAQVIDGNRSFSNGARWRTNTFPGYVDITFDSAKAVDTINVFSQQASGNVEPTLDMVSNLACSAFDIQYWNSTSSNWETFANGSVTGNTKVWYQLTTSSAVTTTKIRINFASAPSGGWARLIEVEAWGSGN